MDGTRAPQLLAARLHLGVDAGHAAGHPHLLGVAGLLPDVARGGTPAPDCLH